MNLTVWESLEALRAFVFDSDHVRVLRERAHWFEPITAATTVLWWVPADHTPTVDEARKRLEMLRTRGASESAFSFSEPFPAPESADH